MTGLQCLSPYVLRAGLCDVRIEASVLSAHAVRNLPQDLPGVWLPQVATWCAAQTGRHAQRTLMSCVLTRTFTMKSDTQLQQDVIAALQWEQSVNAARIGVQVEHGVVILSGHVSCEEEKHAAVRVALSVPGANAISIAIVVVLTPLNHRGDPEIASSAFNAVKWSIEVPQDSVRVVVEGGRVSLFGNVERDSQRLAAELAVCDLMGVAGVNNEIVAEQLPSQNRPLAARADGAPVSGP